MTSLFDLVETNQRFSRSINVDRDRGARSIEGYLPTGRALDVVRRIAKGFSEARFGRAFSITGPHGGGKSSLAVFLDALLAPRKGPDFAAAVEILSASDHETSDAALAGLYALDPSGSGFLRVFVTAQREPVTVTLARGLAEACRREFGKNHKRLTPVFEDRPDLVTPQEILEALQRLARRMPVMVLIDEFGKNLEAFADGMSEGDPYLLQAIAEIGQGVEAQPIVIATLQHLSFDDYVQGVTAVRRKEWAKVQGRFQDVPYVESGQQARSLIAACIQRSPSPLDDQIDAWFKEHRADLMELGLSDLIDDSKRAYPLHPVSLAVLPDLCARYGQNERTLFSFLGGPEPLAMREILRNMPADSVEFIGLDRIYDYFLDSATTTIGAASQASRWLEIERRIRDSVGITDRQTRTLKTIGVLNLTSSGGTLRASRNQLRLLLGSEVEADLEELNALGLITYRRFADEWRVWQGSDYDIQGSIDLARREILGLPLADLLNQCISLPPTVASRHSQDTGVLRLYAQTFDDLGTGETPEAGPEVDGLVVYNVSRSVTVVTAPRKPLVACTAEDPETLLDPALEVVALNRALERARDADHVARAELQERFAGAMQLLEEQVRRTWGPDSSWELVGHGELLGKAGLSAVLSEASDAVYCKTPPVKNEMVARRELTSQGAKARRMLIDAMLVCAGTDSFGIEGYGADRAMYEAVFRYTGMHSLKGDRWAVGRPSEPQWAAAWDAVHGRITHAVKDRLPLTALYEVLEAPPFGMKAGVIPVLVCAILQTHATETALYEHGSLVLHLDDAVAERLAKNPSHFTVKNPATQSAVRRRVVAAMCRDLLISTPGGETTFLEATTAVFRLLRQLPQFSHKTKQLPTTSIAVRQAFTSAAEPDVLFFETLPKLLIDRPITVQARISDEEIAEYTSALASHIREIKNSYPELLKRIQSHLAQSVGARSVDLVDFQTELGGLARQLDGRVLEPRLRAFIGALTRPHLNAQLWLENVAMVVSGGNTPGVWTDETEQRFIIQVEELGGAFRRTMAVLFARIAESDREFEALRVAVTRPDGSEYAEVVAITDADRAVASPAVKQLLDSLTESFHSRERACHTLMALLAGEVGFPTLDEEVDLRGPTHLRNQRG